MEQQGITELSRLFGISAEALRKYEAKGLLEMEFSLYEVNELIQEGELPELEAVLRQKKEAAADLILKYQEHFRVLEQKEREIHDLTDRRNSFWLEYSPAHYGIDFGPMILPEKGPLWSAFQVFMKQASFAFFCGIFDENQIYRKTRLALEEKYISQKDREELGDILVHVPSRLCACMMIGEGYGALIEDQLRKQVQLIQEQGYRATGNAIARIVFWNKKDEHYYAYHRFWVPIEKR